MTNGPDLLLEWCSARRRGSRAQFDDACQHLFGDEYKPAAVLGLLETLSHVEVDWDRGQWAVTPPVLSSLPGAGGNAVLFGSRSKGTWAALEQLASEGVLTSLKAVPQDMGAPSAWFVGCRSWRAIEAVANHLGAIPINRPRRHYQEHFGDIDSLLTKREKQFPYSGFQAERLNGEDLRYYAIDGPRARASGEPGCFRQLHSGKNAYWFVSDSGTIHRVDRWTATHAELLRLRSAGRPSADVVGWDQDSLRLLVLGQAQLPMPWARVAMACSGLAPQMIKPDSQPWYQIYEGVEPKVYLQIMKDLKLDRMKATVPR